MIDFLSNADWIKPQIDFLLFLQNFRTGHFQIFDKFFLSVTILGEFWLPTVLCAIVYWCIDFKAGIYLFSLEGFNIFLTHFFKMLACVYRPWVLDSKIQPSELAVPYAKGYSFPSGHSAMSSSVFGGTAYLLKNNKKLCLFLIGLILLVGFSRLWLGVHTPQDVICGLSIGLFLVFANNALINWAEKDKNRYLYLLLIVNILVVLAAIFICYFNTYRIDYVSGELLVNPQSQKYVMLVACGYGLGLVNGAFLCRRFCPFNPKDASLKQRIYRGIIGATGIIFALRYVVEHVFLNVVDLKIAIPTAFCTGIVITLIYPLIFTRFEKSEHKTA